MEPMTNPATVLEYAPPRSIRRWWQRIVLMLLLGFLAVAGYAKGPWAWQRGRLLYWQHRCMTYTASPEQVVYQELAPASGEAAPPTAPGLVPLANPWPNGPWAQGFTRPVHCWDAYAPRAGVSRASPEGLLFLHERRSAGGVSRLVYVGFHSLTRYGPLLDRLAWTVVRPATVRGDPSAGYGTGAQPWRFSSLLTPPPRDLRLFAGQPDPADPSHFTIAYELDGSPGTIDGWLRDCPKPLPIPVVNAQDSDGDGIADIRPLLLSLYGLGDGEVYVSLSARDGPPRSLTGL